MREEQIWFWKVHRHPIWGTFITRARMTEEETRKAYPNLRVDRVDSSLMTIQMAETAEDLAARLPGGRPMP